MHIIIFKTLCICFTFTNSVDHDAMPRYAAFHHPNRTMARLNTAVVVLDHLNNR